MTSASTALLSRIGKGQNILLLGMIIVFLLVILNFWIVNRNNNHERRYISHTNEIQVLSQQIAKSASEAATGNLDAFDELSRSRQLIQINIDTLKNGHPDSALPASPAEAAGSLRAVDDLWQLVNNNAAAILSNNSLVLSLFDASNNFASSVSSIQAETDKAVTRLTQSGAPTQQVYITGRQLVLADRMLRRVTEILKGGTAAVSATDKFSRDAAFFERVLSGLLNGDPVLGISQVRNSSARSSLQKVMQQFESSKTDIETILAASTDLSAVRAAADDILLDSEDLFLRARELAITYRRMSETSLFPSVGAGLLGSGLFLLLLILFGWALLVHQRNAARDTRDVNQRNQDAILRLMDELSSLADGDLTVQATVTEDITGSIADSVNYAVESLRDLVTEINKTAQEVEASAQETRATTTQLAESSNHQAVQVRSATDTITNMSRSFDHMAKRSLESADVAQHSVEIASTGANKVQETIAGMDTIRDQIQETSKRIKRLGESSQEIGDIVELINGIAEQTNILALNAAIQAASAGGAGRGFAVVADEVQRLAERAANATRQIETLVETIRADTAEAVMSMESTTSEVVRGAKLAEEAGDKLERMEKVSADLSALIQSIATEAQSQSSAATEVAAMMTGIRDVSIQTAEGTTHTAEVVDHLADLVSKLRESVADFKLPE